MLRSLSLLVVLSTSFVSGQLSLIKEQREGDGNCDAVEFTRQTRCIAATGQAVRQTCESLCMESQTNTTALDKRCRGFSFIDRASITVDFANCKQQAKSRCDLFFGCTTIAGARKVTDPIKCIALVGIPDCPAPITTTTPVASVVDQVKTYFMGLMTPEGPTVTGYIIFGSAAGVVIIALIAIIACCCCCCKKEDKKPSRFQ